MSKPQLLSTGPMMDLIERGIEKSYTVHRLHEASDREALLKKIAPDVSAICTGGHTGVKTDEALMARFPKLKVVGNFGVGYDSVDVAAAARRGVIVTNTPDVLTEEVADTTFALLLRTARELYQAEKWLRDGRWAKEGDYRLTASLRDRSVGIVGLGRIGKAIARRCEAFLMPVSYFGRNPQAGVSLSLLQGPGRHGPRRGHADRGHAGRRRNPEPDQRRRAGGAGAPRHPDQHVARLGGGRAGAARRAQGAQDPRRPASTCSSASRRSTRPILELDNAALFPHVGSGSVYTRDAMGQLVVDNLAAYAERKPPKTPVPETPFKGW